MKNIQQQITKEEVDLMSKVKSAANSTIEAEIDILRNGRVERNFTSCFATQISKQFKNGGIRSDPFYNKHLGATKYLNGKVVELDIAVHERNTDQNNLVAIEIETNNRPARDDIWKIEGLTQGLDGYGYRLGLYIVFGVSQKAGQIITMEWYKNGKLL
jgi:hypothetical protein